MKPNVSVMLRLDFTICVWLREITWLPAANLRETRVHGVGVGGGGRVMLVIILRREGMRGIRVPVQVGDRLIGLEEAVPGISASSGKASSRAASTAGLGL